MKKSIILTLFILIILSSFTFALTDDNADICITYDDADLSGSDPTDLYGNSTLENVGATTGASGIIGEGFDLEGEENDYIKIGLHDFSSGNFTINWWEKKESTTSFTASIGFDRTLSTGFIPFQITYYTGAMTFWGSSNGANWDICIRLERAILQGLMKQ